MRLVACDEAEPSWLLCLLLTFLSLTVPLRAQFAKEREKHYKLERHPVERIPPPKFLLNKGRVKHADRHGD